MFALPSELQTVIYAFRRCHGGIGWVLMSKIKCTDDLNIIESCCKETRVLNQNGYWQSIMMYVETVLMREITGNRKLQTNNDEKASVDTEYRVDLEHQTAISHLIIIYY